MTRTAARLASIILLAACAGCGGGGNSSEPDHDGVEAFPDVLEIARTELGETAPLYAATVSEEQISFVNAKIGRPVRVKYDTAGVFTGNERVRIALNPRATYLISEIPADAPAKLLAAIRGREDGEVTDFAATLSRDTSGELLWRAQAKVGGATRTYRAELDGTLKD